ncbi:MAG TPA: endolytic transglycosylase MltG [Flavisolibacter sp.]|nr:endolytic transglycosylase MltG [Flavisolibacter sp.]
MKKLLVIILLIIIITAGAAAWIFLGSSTNFSTPKTYLYIRTNASNKKAILDSIRKENIVGNIAAFSWLAGQMHYWNNIKPGKYEIDKGASLLTIVRMLKNGHQVPVHLVITKLRTKEDLARVSGRMFEFDSSAMHHFLDNGDSLKRFNADTNIAMVNVLPDSYTFFWNTTPSAVYQKFYSRAKKFWTTERRTKAADHGLSPAQAYILSSIIEEETNNNSEKGNIASVYLNRMNKGMPLQADPTIKFAMHDFALKRIYEKYLFTESPYNTYRNKGLPPGPICTPSEKTIDAVLNSPQTDYMYFVANSEFNGTHVFSSSYGEHMKNARQYQQALNHYDSLKKAK